MFLLKICHILCFHLLKVTYMYHFQLNDPKKGVTPDHNVTFVHGHHQHDQALWQNSATLMLHISRRSLPFLPIFLTELYNKITGLALR